MPQLESVAEAEVLLTIAHFATVKFGGCKLGNRRVHTILQIEQKRFNTLNKVNSSAPTNNIHHPQDAGKGCVKGHL